MMKNKKAFEFSFGWLFGLLIGAFILFLAIYIVVRIISVSKLGEETAAAKQAIILLTPMETGLEDSQFFYFTVRKEMTIFNEIKIGNSLNPFGEQRIRTSLNLGIGSNKGIGEDISVRNKYLFSQKKTTGKKFFLLSKPLELPFKIADLIILWSDQEKYCFVDSTHLAGIEKDFRDDLNSFAHFGNLEDYNLFNASRAEDCPAESVKVCFFSSGGCDIEVNPTGNGGTVTHKEESKTVTFYTDENNKQTTLLIAAIFSNPEIYEKQIKRLMKGRAFQLATLLQEKAVFLDARGCHSNIAGELQSYKNALESLEDSSYLLNSIKDTSDNLRRRNEQLNCKIF